MEEWRDGGWRMKYGNMGRMGNWVWDWDWDWNDLFKT
jgi:hypothetical protein